MTYLNLEKEISRRDLLKMIFFSNSTRQVLENCDCSRLLVNIATIIAYSFFNPKL